MINPNFVIIGVILQLIGSWSYLIGTIKGTVKPNRVSWLLWSIAPLVAFAAEVGQGVGIQALTTFIVGFAPLIIFIASFVNKKSVWKLSKFDIACGAISLVGILLWCLTKVGNVAIIFSIMADAFASIPTIVKSYRDPDTESDTIFWFGFLNAVIGILAIGTWNFQQYGFPIYLVFVNLTLAILIRFRIGKKNLSR